MQIILMWNFGECLSPVLGGDSLFTDHCLEMPESIIRLGETVRHRVCSELHEHYKREGGTESCAERLGKLMALSQNLLVSPSLRGLIGTR